MRCHRPAYSTTTADLANGFAPNSPYNAAYSLNSTQKAIFGEASYEFSQFKLTAGGRYYDFEETRKFKNGGIFTPQADETDKVKSDGFSPRGIVSWIPNRNLSVNFQVAKGFRLGGVNDPLNVPLCKGSRISRHSAVSRRLRTKRCGTMKAASNIRSGPSPSTRRLSTTTSRTCRSR